MRKGKTCSINWWNFGEVGTNSWGGMSKICSNHFTVHTAQCTVHSAHNLMWGKRMTMMMMIHCLPIKTFTTSSVQFQDLPRNHSYIELWDIQHSIKAGWFVAGCRAWFLPAGSFASVEYLFADEVSRAGGEEKAAQLYLLRRRGNPHWSPLSAPPLVPETSSSDHQRNGWEREKGGRQVMKRSVGKNVTMETFAQKKSGIIAKERTPK